MKISFGQYLYRQVRQLIISVCILCLFLIPVALLLYICYKISHILLAPSIANYLPNIKDYFHISKMPDNTLQASIFIIASFLFLLTCHFLKFALNPLYYLKYFKSKGFQWNTIFIIMKIEFTKKMIYTDYRDKERLLRFIRFQSHQLAKDIPLLTYLSSIGESQTLMFYLAELSEYLYDPGVWWKATGRDREGWVFKLQNAYHFKAYKIYKNLAESGHKKAQLKLSKFYLDEYWFDQYQLASKKPNHGNYFDNLRDREKHYESQAFFYAEKAAEQNLSSAQFYLGKFYYYGIGCEKNLELANKWIMKAYLKGNAEAQDFLRSNANLGLINFIKNATGWQRLCIALSILWFSIVAGFTFFVFFDGFSSIFRIGSDLFFGVFFFVWSVPIAIVWSFYFVTRWIVNGFKS